MPTRSCGCAGSSRFLVILVAMAQALGVELVLGAFLAGAITSLLGGDDKTPLRERLDAIGYGFLGTDQLASCLGNASSKIDNRHATVRR